MRDAKKENLGNSKVNFKMWIWFPKEIKCRWCFFHEFTKTVYQNLDKNMKTVSIFIDLAKANDSVLYEIFIDKLNNYSYFSYCITFN